MRPLGLPSNALVQHRSWRALGVQRVRGVFQAWRLHGIFRARRLRGIFQARRLRGAVLPLVLLGLWQCAAKWGAIDPHLFPPPSELYGTLSELAVEGRLGPHLWISTARVLLGFGLGALAGVLFGVLVGLSRDLEAFLDPTFQGVRAIPSLAWVPLLLIWLGIDEAPKLMLIAIGAFFPVYLNVASGIRNVDRKLVELGQIHGLDRVGLAWRIFLPATLPNLFTGLRTGLALSWMFLVAAELMAASRGLGYLLTDGRETGRVDVVLVAILLLAVMGKLSDGVLQALERACLHWRDAYVPAGLDPQSRARHECA